MSIPRSNEVTRKLRSLRNEQGLSTRQLAARSGISQSKVSKMENGQVRPSVIDIRRITEALDVRDEVRESLVDAVHAHRIELEEAGGWRASTHPQPFIMEREREAKRVRSLCTFGIPAMLQIPPYMQSAHRCARLGVPLRDFISDRLHRQAHLAGGTVQLEVILPRRALLAGVADVDVQVEELKSLLRKERLTNVRLGVLNREFPLNGFLTVDDDLAVLDQPVWTMLSQQYSTVRALNQQFDDLVDDVLWDEDAEEIVADCIRELEFSLR